MWSILFNKNVAAKIALITSGALLFVSGLALLIFYLLDIQFLSKLTLVQVLMAFFGLLVFVEVVFVVLTTDILVQRPLQKLADVMQIAERGNFWVRMEETSEDELGVACHGFNRMMMKIKELNSSKVNAERELVVAQEGLKYKGALAEKAHIIESTNEKLEASLKDLSILFHISQSLSHTLELSELFHTVSRLLTKTLNHKEFSLLFVDENKEFLEVRAAHGFTNNERIHGMKFCLGEGICGVAAVQKRIIYIADTSREPRYLYYKGEKEEDGSFVSIPLIVGEGVVGVLNVGRLEKNAFSPEDIQLLESLANQIAIAYHRSKLYMKTKELSVTDELTGIYNRRHFQKVLRMEWKRSYRFNRPLAILMIDVDYFKQYNDTFGHIQGDAALRELAHLLVKNVREVDTVARFGGEEFVIILADTNLKEAVLVGEKLKRFVEKNSSLFAARDGNPYSLTVSVGVSAYPDHRVATEEELSNTADIALYKAKALGRNRVVAFEGHIEMTRLEPHFVAKRRGRKEEAIAQ